LLYVELLVCAPRVARDFKEWTIDTREQSAAYHVKRALIYDLAERVTPASDLAAAELIIGELISNVARHTPGKATITLESREGSVIFTVCDSGAAFSANGESPPDPLAECGRGLFLVRSLALNVRVEHTSEGNRVSATLPVYLSGAVLSSIA